MKQTSGITVLINTLNEKDNIVECIKTVQWADEILVIDMKSDDATQELARAAGARVLIHERVGYVEPARNYGIDKAKFDWIFVVDADERIPKALAKKLQEVANSDEADVSFIAEKNMIFGRWMQHGLLWPDYHPRFFKRGMLRWSDNVHDIPKPKGRVQHIEATEELSIQHFSRSYMTVTGFVENYNRYSTYEADAMNNPNYHFRRRHFLVFPIREFRTRFFKEKGFKDGYFGLRLAILFAFYKFLVLAKFVEKYRPKVVDDANRGKWSYIINLLRDK